MWGVVGGRTLEILATNKTGVDIVVGEGYAAQLLKVKVQHRTVNGVKIGAASAPICKGDELSGKCC